MPLIDVSCEACETVSEVYRSLADWPKTPDCKVCLGPTVQVHLPKAVQWSVDPVVVFKAPDGSFRFPGDTNGKMAHQYAKEGLERIEIRGAAEMRSFEGKMNAREQSILNRRFEAQQEQREKRQHVNRSELHHRMSSMSNHGRAVARAAMGRNDAKPVKRPGEPGFASEVYSYDRSNREESRGPDGRRRRD